MTWVCDKCYGEMEYEHEEKNYNRVHCPRCGETWYVDDNDEYINENYSNNSDIYDIALAWASHGKDEEYTFGYSEEELEEALK